MELFEWFSINWFTLLQSVGIVGSLWYAARSFRWDAKVRRIGNLIQIVEGHRQIWSQLYAKPELARVRDPKPDLENRPITLQEEIFVSQVILHLSSVFEAKQENVIGQIEGLEIDVRAFFEKPIPGEIWQRKLPFQNSDFVIFVEKTLTKKEGGGVR